MYYMYIFGRPNAVAIMDAYEFPDVMLNSVLGSYDGNVYERIFESTKRDEMNKSVVCARLFYCSKFV